MGVTPEKKQPWIRPLPERLINKIAAGEVVERPASVVKELVENALDAGATRVTVEIEKSGVKLIRIIDDGCGIGDEQIEIAFSRHATSKISEFSDLDRVVSYGFRGEALPSISSVARVRMVSRPADSETGTEIVIEGGVVQNKKPVSAPVGTTIEVADLFYNTPARRKFLKAETTEARHITRVCTALAMGRADVAFTYRLNGRKVFSLPEQQHLSDRVRGLLSPSREFVPIAGESDKVSIRGFVGYPDMAQSNRNAQYLFINGRLIQSPTLSHAVAAGYAEMLPRGQFPIGAVLISVDPLELDVNVHPAKTEVRLSNEREMHSHVRRAVAEGLREHGVVPSLKIGEQPHGPRVDGHQQMFEIPRERRSDSYVIPGIQRGRENSAEEITEGLKKISESAQERVTERHVVDTETGEIIGSTSVGQSPSHSPSRQWEYIGRFSELYLICRVGNDLYIVDQHAAHERVLYEHYLQVVDKQSEFAQQLLLPVNVELSAEQFQLFEESREALKKVGFVVEEFGGQTVRIEGVPSNLTRRSPEKVLRALLDDIASLKSHGHEMRKAVAQSMACRAAIMAGDKLSVDEVNGLMEQLEACKNSYTCPHGRPTFIKIQRSDLDRQFGRE